ncbi:MAG: DUF5402 family protein [Firmicutes bacterium]|nr:DUF5402 family protein [Bacillota bacterium]
MYKTLEQMDASIRKSLRGSGALTDIAFHLRSCGCFLNSISFEGFTSEMWKENASNLIQSVETLNPDWDVIYINPFPGMNLVRKITLRKFCPHCKENFDIDGELGMGAVVYKTKSQKLPF